MQSGKMRMLFFCFSYFMSCGCIRMELVGGEIEVGQMEVGQTEVGQMEVV